MDFIPHIREAQYLKDYTVKIWFNDGTVRIVDLESYTNRAGVFAALRDKGMFKRVFVDLNTLCWPNGADIAPERLYEIGEVVSMEKALKV